MVVVGLALDYCVQATALDARAAGYEVVVLTDATRAVNVKPDDGEPSTACAPPASARAAPRARLPACGYHPTLTQRREGLVGVEGAAVPRALGR